MQIFTIICFCFGVWLMARRNRSPKKREAEWQKDFAEHSAEQLAWAKDQDEKTALYKLSPEYLAAVKAEEEKQERKRRPSTVHLHLHKHETLHIDEVKVVKNELHLHRK